MRAKMLLLFLLAFVFSYTSYSQTIFYLNYHFTNIKDTASCRVFLVRHEDGTGFYRVRFYDENSKKDILVDLDMEEKYDVDKKGDIDTTKIYFKGSNPKIIEGDITYKYYPKNFWFKLDPASGIYEPWGVTSPEEKSVAQGSFINPPDLLEQKDLTKDLVSTFFLENEEFYKNLFSAKTRGLSFDQKKTKLYLVIVANTDDKEIGPTCLLDKDRTLKTFGDLSEFLGIGFEPKTVFGKDYSKKNVENAIGSLNPGSKDIVIFYYTGHGFSKTNDNRKFPNLALSNKSFEDAMKNSLNIEDIFTQVKAKGARFNLVFSDCCNTDPNVKPNVSGDIARTRSSALGWNLENCKTLFLNENPMSILMTAATKGEASAGNLAYGGFFTHHFRTTLLQYFGQFHQNVDWDVLLKEAETQTITRAQNTRCSAAGEPVKICVQHPFHTIQ